MANLKIRIFKLDQTKPETVATIPLKVVRIATKIIPKKALSTLEREGIGLRG